MSKRLRQTIDDLLDQLGEVSSGDIAERAGVTRQAAHYHLSRMVKAGDLVAEGGGRGRRYRRRSLLAMTLPSEGLEEDVVWKRILSDVPEFDSGDENFKSVASFAFTEILNNAIEHSGSPQVHISVFKSDQNFRFRVSDEGIGIFRSVREKLRLEDDFDAVQEISKGKTTTDPQRHSGQGIFFTSKAVDIFNVASERLEWTVDNRRDDQALGTIPFKKGTTVQFVIPPHPDHSMKEVFDQYSDPDDYAFNRSKVVLRLFDYDIEFLSRSEAKRLVRNLDRFEEVIIDFKGVNEVGQGFIDEIFRVWRQHHPETRLVPINMVSAVEFMVRRGLGDRP